MFLQSPPFCWYKERGAIGSKLGRVWGTPGEQKLHDIAHPVVVLTPTSPD